MQGSKPAAGCHNVHRAEEDTKGKERRALRVRGVCCTGAELVVQPSLVPSSLCGAQLVLRQTPALQPVKNNASLEIRAGKGRTDDKKKAEGAAQLE